MVLTACGASSGTSSTAKGDCPTAAVPVVVSVDQWGDIVNRLAANNELPDAVISDAGLKVTPHDTAVPETAQAVINQTARLLPHVKITDLLAEVDTWTDFTRHFTHLKTGDTNKDKTLLLTVILADAINLGLQKMAESCPGTTYAKLSWLQAWYIRDETYSRAAPPSPPR